jgi:hypothetical protein
MGGKRDMTAASAVEDPVSIRSEKTYSLRLLRKDSFKIMGIQQIPRFRAAKKDRNILNPLVSCPLMPVKYGPRMSPGVAIPTTWG